MRSGMELNHILIVCSLGDDRSNLKFLELYEVQRKCGVNKMYFKKR